MRQFGFRIPAALGLLLCLAASAQAQNEPNILMIMGDDIGGPESFEYGRWMADRAFLIVPSQALVGQWVASFKEFPIRQKPASFNLDEVMQQLTAPAKQ